MSYMLTESKINDLNEKCKSIIDKHPEWIEIADRRNKAHIAGVKKFAEKLNKTFPNHDDDKFTHLYIPYILLTIWYNPDYKEEVEKIKKENEDVDNFIKWASLSHVTQNSHHPEYWDKEGAFKREEDKNIVLDATKMPDQDIIEMCCDWSSVGAENRNSPQSWFKKTNGVKWAFSEYQEELINDTLEKLWPGGCDDTASIDHNERYFNDKVWNVLVDKWNEYEKPLSEARLNEEFSFNDFENTLRTLTKEKEHMSNIVGKLTSTGYEPTVNLKGVGSLQSLSFLFSPAVTNYVINLIDSVLNSNHRGAVDDKLLKSLNLDKIELGKEFETRTRIPANFAQGILNSLNKVNSSKLNNKLLLINKFISNLKKHARTINNRAQRQEYLEDVKSLMKVVKIVKNIVSNRNSFINVLNKTLLLQESGEEVISEQFVNIYESIN